MHIVITDANSVLLTHAPSKSSDEATGLDAQWAGSVLRHFRNCAVSEQTTLQLILWGGTAQWRKDLLHSYNDITTFMERHQGALGNLSKVRGLVHKALKSFPVIHLTHPSAEAADLAWGLSRQFSQQGHLVTLRTGDTNWLQLVGQRTRWTHPRKAVEVVELERFSQVCDFSTPAHVAPVNALTGEAHAGIPGLVDVTRKRANALLCKYGSLAAVFEATDDFMTFSQEPYYLQPLLTQEGRRLVLSNVQVLDLSLGPALCGSDVMLDIGSFEELDLFEALVDLNLHQLQDSFDPWTKPLRRELARSELSTLKRALENLPKSWTRD